MNIPERLRSPLRIGSALVLGVALGATGTVLLGSQEAEELPPADSAPLEYLYLDSARVLAYLGQVEQGLASTETRELSERQTESGAIKGQNLVEVSRSVERQRAAQKVVTMTEADRFYTLLRLLRKAENRRPLIDVDTLLTERNTFGQVMESIKGAEEGDFVRIRHARLFLPPYAAVYPKVRYTEYYTAGGRLQQPRRPLYAPVSTAERDDVARYREAIGDNPRLPFVVPTLDAMRSPAANSVAFVLPTRYSGFSNETSLLRSPVTVVGKIVYKDARLPSQTLRNDPTPTHYLDRETLATFGPALRKAPTSLLNDLGLDRGKIVARVTEAASIDAPVVVIVPLAIYQ